MSNKSHCKNGHLLDAANTFYARRGERGCRVCRRNNHRKWLSTRQTAPRVKPVKPAVARRRPGRPIGDRLFGRLVQEADCWIWTGAANKGYGVIGVGRKQWQTHRLSYELLRAPIPEGLTIDHLCRRPLCCNPWHMDPVPLRVNVRRARLSRS